MCADAPARRPSHEARASRWIVVVALGAAALAGPAVADMGPLQDLLTTGTEGAWTGRHDGRVYRLENRSQAGAIHYVYGPVSAASQGRRDIGVAVTLDGAEPAARAGLLYGYDAAQRSYWLLVAGPGGEVEWIRRDAQGFRTTLSRSSGRQAAGPVTLTLQEQGRMLALRANGETIATLESDGLGRGAAGIVAVGRGRFGFADYRDAAGGGTHAASSTPGATPSVAPSVAPGAAPSAARAAAPSVAPSAGPSVAQAGAAPRLVERTIVDAFGFEQPIAALKLSVPEGWRLDGSVRWDRWNRCWIDQTQVHFVISAPDGRQRIELIPGGSWQWHSDWAAMPQLAQLHRQRTGCQVRPITDGRSFMQAYLRALRPGASVSAVQLDPGETAALERVIAKAPPEPGTQRRAEAWVARLSYPGEHGTTVHEHLTTGLVFQVMAAASMQGTPGRFLVGQVVGTGSSLAVDREPDLAFSRRVQSTVTVLPAYAERLARHRQNMAELQMAALQREKQAVTAAQAARRAAAPAAGGGPSATDIAHEGYMRRSRLTAAGQAKVVDGIHERTAWSAGNGHVEYLPQRYQRAFQLPNDRYVGTNDAFFQPLQGTELQPHRD